MESIQEKEKLVSLRLSKVVKPLAILLLLVLIISIVFLYKTFGPQIPVATGFVAKKACSYHYISERALDQIEEVEFNASPLNLVSFTNDPKAQSVTASLFGLGNATAQYKKNLGCVLLHGKDDANISLNTIAKNSSSSVLPRKTSSSIRSDAIAEAVDLAMDAKGKSGTMTTSFLVIQNDSIVSENYGKGYDSETEILGWSMTKSICNLLIGILVKEGKLSLQKTNLYDKWTTDKRKNITLANLLHMDSGLSWTEEYEDICDVTQGLFLEEDFVSFVVDKPLESEIGSAWEYSSGTTNLVSGIIRKQFYSVQEYLAFPQTALFSKLEIGDAQIETDESGNLILSSYGYAKARDWAKLGILYKNQGNWQGTQIVDTSYVQFSITPTVNSEYGSHIWLNRNQKKYPSAPADMYYFSGYDGQYVFMFPSHDMIIVRTGISKGPEFNMDKIIGTVLSGISE